MGKEADVGAQISVPSVRGDKVRTLLLEHYYCFSRTSLFDLLYTLLQVLWMCGGHTATPEGGMSRVVRTVNEIEPCRMEVKAAAPIKVHLPLT